MSMKYDLSSRRIVVHGYVYSVRLELFFDCHADLLCRSYQLASNFLRSFIYVFEMFFGNDEGVSDIYRLNVQKSKSMFILIHLFTGYFSLHYFTKNAVIHGQIITHIPTWEALPPTFFYVVK